MVDMNTPLAPEIEAALAHLKDGEVVKCDIKYKDNGELHTGVTIALHGDMYGDDSPDEIDDGVFFYCDSVNDFRALLKEDSGEDFVVVGFDNGKVGGSWHS